MWSSVHPSHTIIEAITGVGELSIQRIISSANIMYAIENAGVTKYWASNIAV